MSYTPKHYAAKHASRVRIASVTLAGAATMAAGIGFAAAPANASGSGVWDRVAACESGGNWSINTGNGFSGGLQFTPSTWAAYGGQGSPTTASKAEQIRVAQRTLAAQGPGAWPVCSIKAGLTRANGGAASSAGVSRSTVRQAAPVKKTYKQNTYVAPKHYVAQAPKAAAPQAAPQAPAAAQTSNLKKIVVKKGDTLAKLAQRYDINTWQSIWAVNRSTVANPNLIFIGQSLNLPNATN